VLKPNTPSLLLLEPTTPRPSLEVPTTPAALLMVGPAESARLAALLLLPPMVAGPVVRRNCVLSNPFRNSAPTHHSGFEVRIVHDGLGIEIIGIVFGR
jgi:hypothetical protein